jgi:DNA uptake protein ComE-like DNA-binding protein
LNKADTTELKKIPGIGSAIARMIVTYRAQLGGFYEVGQLRDIHLDASQLQSWFAIDEADIRKLSVNSLSADRLRRHPYINFYQAKALVEHRRKHGARTSLQPFVLYEEFTASDLDRLSHYLSFD